MRSVEASGKTLEEATAAAASELGVSKDQLEVDVLQEPRKLFGLLGGQECRIRATVVADAAAEADEAPPVATEEEEEPEQVAAPAAPAEDEIEGEDDEAVAPEGSAPDMIAGNAVTALNDILGLMGIDAEAVLDSASPDEVSVHVSGENLGNLIGRHGATLNALQLIVAIIANRDISDGCRVVVDVEGYRERREQMLERMALSHAAKAKEAGQEVVLTDLKPFERRLVHLFLKEDPDVETYSEGEGDDRHLVISPTQ